MTFIRAPYIETAGKEVEILSVVDQYMVAARQKNVLVTAYHPELTSDNRVHRYFVENIVVSRG
jgi:5'-phosphate synthase pdxT subunit